MAEWDDGVYLLGADAKDLWLSNQWNGTEGYAMRRPDGTVLLHKFLHKLDSSLELMKLREIYHKVYRRSGFSFWENGKEYAACVINVTFHYSCKEFNAYPGNRYIKYGVSPQEVDWKDGAYIKDGELAAIQTGCQVKTPLAPALLGNWFVYKNGMYQLKSCGKTLLSTAELRNRLYVRGFYCDGIHFVRYKRSSGSSRVGKCLFIDEALYTRMHRWEMCGLKVREGDPLDLAALESYLSLTLSSIIGTIRLDPAGILVIDDYTSVFRDRVIRVDSDGERLRAAPADAEISNNIWDGQSLIDPTVMGKYRPYGFLLLRNRFFKSACFQCDIQQWFRDHGVTEISQLHGFTLAKRVQDIRLITTPSSIKYLKFGKLKDWLHQIDPIFGVVKHEKPTPFFGGRLVHLHYQLLNTLPLNKEEVASLAAPSLQYLSLIKTDPCVLKYQIKYGCSPPPPQGFRCKNEVIYHLLGVNRRFYQTKLYHQFRTELTTSMMKSMKCGHLLVPGNYSTMLGNPIEMLRQSIGIFDGSSQLGHGSIHTRRFPYGKPVLGSRSPHVTMGNVWLPTNRANELIDRYFHLTDEIVCINSIGENTLQRLSGCDFDSDTVLLTDHPLLLQAAARYAGSFLVPTNFVPAKKRKRAYTAQDKAALDTANSVNKIGEIINLSQELNSLLWHRFHQGVPLRALQDLYCDIAKLDVASSLEIDKAKKEYAVDSAAEIKRIKQKYARKDTSGRIVSARFLGTVARMKGYGSPDKKCYQAHDTAMDYLQQVLCAFRLPAEEQPVLPFSALLRPAGYSSKKVKYAQITETIQSIRLLKQRMAAVWQSTDPDLDNCAKYQLSLALKGDCLHQLEKHKWNACTAYRLLCAMESPENKDIRQLMFYTLFASYEPLLTDMVEHSREPLAVLRMCSTGDIELFGIRFCKHIPAGQPQNLQKTEQNGRTQNIITLKAPSPPDVSPVP